MLASPEAICQRGYSLAFAEETGEGLQIGESCGNGDVRDGTVRGFQQGLGVFQAKLLLILADAAAIPSFETAAELTYAQAVYPA